MRSGCTTPSVHFAMLKDIRLFLRFRSILYSEGDMKPVYRQTRDFAVKSYRNDQLNKTFVVTECSARDSLSGFTETGCCYRSMSKHVRSQSVWNLDLLEERNTTKWKNVSCDLVPFFGMYWPCIQGASPPRSAAAKVLEALHRWALRHRDLICEVLNLDGGVRLENR